MSRRDASCPLCGAKMTAAQVLDACEDLVGEGVLACHCPYCQGYLEVMPAAGRIDIGYLRNQRFDVVLSLPCEGLAVELTEDGMRLSVQSDLRRTTIADFSKPSFS